MREDWPPWAREAWRRFTVERRDRARRVWTTLAEAFGGVLVGPGPLVRLLVDEGTMGHRSTLETISLLAGEGLIHVRNAAEGPVLWIPESLMPEARETTVERRPRFLTPPASNGSCPTAPPTARS